MTYITNTTNNNYNHNNNKNYSNYFFAIILFINYNKLKCFTIILKNICFVVVAIINIVNKIRWRKNVTL